MVLQRSDYHFLLEETQCLHASASWEPALLNCHLRMETLRGRALLTLTRWQDRGWGPHVMGGLPHCTVLEAMESSVLLLCEGSRCENVDSVSTEKAPLPVCQPSTPSRLHQVGLGRQRQRGASWHRPADLPRTLGWSTSRPG